MDRRQFLISLFGTTITAALGPLPPAIAALPEPEFLSAITAIAQSTLTAAREIYTDGTSYAFPTLTYLPNPPWLTLTPPAGNFRPLRAESDRISAEVIAKLQGAQQS